MRISILIIIILLFFPSLPVTASDPGAPEVGKHAPQFELANLSGKTVTLAGYQGGIVLLNFWSTRCAPCTAEMPSLNALYLALKGSGLQVLAVAINAAEKPVREFVDARKIAFPVLMDRDQEVFFDLYAGPALPVSYLIDRNGVIVEKFAGPRQWDTPAMKSRILRLLEKR